MSEKPNKIYRGAYEYIQNNMAYSEESFDVYKHHNGDIQFKIEVLTRVANGEFLKMNVEYFLNKDYNPLNVLVVKTLGKQSVQEVYSVDYKEQAMEFAFVSDDEVVEKKLNIPTRFQIATPCAATSLLMFLNRKFDGNGKNYYNIMTSQNMWKFEEDPTSKTFLIEAPQQGTINIKIGDNNLMAYHYNCYDELDADKLNPIQFFASKYMQIPYRIVAPDKTKFEVKYFNTFERNDALY